MEEECNVGDLASDERGTAARNTDGKPPAELLDLNEVACSMRAAYGDDRPEVGAMFNLGAAQKASGSLRTTSVPVEDYVRAAIHCLTKHHPRRWWMKTAEVMGYGERKYARWNWAKGMPWSVVLGSAVRHLLEAAYGAVEFPLDPESRLPHRAHAICNLMFLAHYAAHYPEGNDLRMWPKPVDGKKESGDE